MQWKLEWIKSDLVFLRRDTEYFDFLFDSLMIQLNATETELGI